MPAKRQKPRNEPTQAPRLSHVEWTAVLVWLEFQLAVTSKELATWREMKKINRNPQTIGAVGYHRDALTAFERAYGATKAHVARMVDKGGFANTTLCPTEVLERN